MEIKETEKALQTHEPSPGLLKSIRNIKPLAL